MFERGSLTLFRARGVPVKAHWTLLLILPYLALMLSVQFAVVAGVAGVHGEVALPPLVWGVLLAVGLFLSVLIHEAAHAAVALRYGGRVRAITLMLLGGVSEISRLPPRPGSEAVMALAGPLASLGLGGLFFALRALVSGAVPPDVELGLFYLGSTNLVLGVFNLLPAFPMDGGRVLRAALASRLGTARATAIAATVGKILAAAMIGLGLLFANLLLVLVAVFVWIGAGAEARTEQVRGMLTGVPIGELVPVARSALGTVPGHATVTEALIRMRQVGQAELVVIDDAGTPVGVVRVDDLAGVAPARQLATTVEAAIAGHGVRHVVVTADMPTEEALDRSAEAEAPYLVVVRPDAAAPGARLVGLLSAGEIATALSVRLAEGGVRGGSRPVTAAG